MARIRQRAKESRHYNPRRVNLGDLFIKSLADHIIEKYHRRHERLREELSEGVDHVYFVHELCECTRKSNLRRLYPRLYYAQARKPPVMLGELIHLGVESLLDYESEVVVDKVIQIEGERVRVAGIMDLYDKERNIVIEVKYVNRLRNKPKSKKRGCGLPLEHHRLQASLYAWLTNASHAEIWYITPKSIETYSLIKPANEKEVEQLIREEKSPRWPEWECKYCPYTKICTNNKTA